MSGTKSQPVVNIHAFLLNSYVLELLLRYIFPFTTLIPTQRAEKERGFELAPGALVNPGI